MQETISYFIQSVLVEFCNKEVPSNMSQNIGGVMDFLTEAPQFFLQQKSSYNMVDRQYDNDKVKKKVTKLLNLFYYYQGSSEKLKQYTKIIGSLEEENYKQHIKQYTQGHDEYKHEQPTQKDLRELIKHVIDLTNQISGQDKISIIEKVKNTKGDLLNNQAMMETLEYVTKLSKLDAKVANGTKFDFSEVTKLYKSPINLGLDKNFVFHPNFNHPKLQFIFSSKKGFRISTSMNSKNLMTTHIMKFLEASDIIKFNQLSKNLKLVYISTDYGLTAKAITGQGKIDTHLEFNKCFDKWGYGIKTELLLTDDLASVPHNIETDSSPIYIETEKYGTDLSLLGLNNTNN